MTKDDAIKNLRVISEELMNEYEKENIDKEKICKLINKQLMEGLYLQL